MAEIEGEDLLRPGPLPRDRSPRRHPVRRQAVVPEEGPDEEEAQKEPGRRRQHEHRLFREPGRGPPLPRGAARGGPLGAAHRHPARQARGARSQAGGLGRQDLRRGARHPHHRAGPHPHGRGGPRTDPGRRAGRQRRRGLRPDHPARRPLFSPSPFRQRPLLAPPEVPGGRARPMDHPQRRCRDRRDHHRARRPDGRGRYPGPGAGPRRASRDRMRPGIAFGRPGGRSPRFDARPYR